jgi:hypothetical protein
MQRVAVPNAESSSDTGCGHPPPISTPVSKPMWVMNSRLFATVIEMRDS